MIKAMMKSSLGAVALGLLLSSGSWAQAPANAPAGATGLCKDGSYWTGPTKKGACHGHKGVQDWFGTAGAAGAAGATGAAGAANAPGGAAATTGSNAGAESGAGAGAATGGKSAPKSGASSHTAAAPGGGPGQVWVNTSSKVYHCPGDRYYGKTKEGQYMSEAEAKAQGARPDHNKPCE